jgi:hypothetical protein
MEHGRALLRSKRERIAVGEWMTALEARAPRNVLVVAAANKLARIAGEVLSSGSRASCCISKSVTIKMKFSHRSLQLDE